MKKPKEKREKKRKMVRAKKKRKEMTKFLFLLSPNLVISYYIYQIRHLIIISALLTEKKGQEEIDCVSSKYTPIQRFEKRPNISLENEQKYCQEMVFSLKKTKKNPFFPFKNKTKISHYQIERKNKTLHYSVLVSLS